jgi:hypothetical protein
MRVPVAVRHGAIWRALHCECPIAGYYEAKIGNEINTSGAGPADQSARQSNGFVGRLGAGRAVRGVSSWMRGRPPLGCQTTCARGSRSERADSGAGGLDFTGTVCFGMLRLPL